MPCTCSIDKNSDTDLSPMWLKCGCVQDTSNRRGIILTTTMKSATCHPLSVFTAYMGVYSIGYTMLVVVLELVRFICTGMVPNSIFKVNVFVASRAGMLPSETTVAKLAKSVGYKTAMIGKDHHSKSVFCLCPVTLTYNLQHLIILRTSYRM